MNMRTLFGLIKTLSKGAIYFYQLFYRTQCNSFLVNFIVNSFTLISKIRKIGDW